MWLHEVDFYLVLSSWAAGVATAVGVIGIIDVLTKRKK